MDTNKSNVRLAVEKILAGIAVHITDDMSEYHESLTTLNQSLRKSGTYGASQVWLALKKTDLFDDFGDDEDLYPSADQYSNVYNEHDLINLCDFELTDFGQAQSLVYVFKNRLRFVIGLGWIIWNGRRWVRDIQDAHIQFGWISARLRLKAMSYRLGQVADPKSNEAKNALNAVRFASARRDLNKVNSALKSASTMQYFVTQANELDRDSFKIGVKNGVVDLRSGRMIDSDPADLISKRANVNYFPDAPCPRWLQFLDEVFKGNQELIQYIKRAVGYSLTGDTREQCFFVMYGIGANGKGTFGNILQKLLGDYATPVQFSQFTGNASKVGDDFAGLLGTRLVIASEGDKGSRLDEPLVKQITGQDAMRVRELYGKPFVFFPQFKIWLMSNHKPVITGTDFGIWRRVKMIPFLMKFSGDNADNQLQEKLESELSGIFAWAVQGAIEWQIHGLDMPQTVIDATEEYRREMDTVGLFIDEMCVTGETRFKSGKMQLYAIYKKWCIENGLGNLGHPNFRLSLMDRGFEEGKSNGKRIWKEIGVLTDDLTGSAGSAGSPKS